VTIEGYSWQLRSRMAAEYIAIHRDPWPELTAAFRDHGVETFSIYTDGSQVFMHSEVVSADSWRTAWSTEVHRRWGELMEPYIDLNKIRAPAVTPLHVVYHQPLATT